MLVVVRCYVVSVHCAVVTLAVRSARGSQVFASYRDLYHAPLRFGHRSAHYIATAGEIYGKPLAIPHVDHFVWASWVFRACAARRAFIAAAREAWTRGASDALVSPPRGRRFLGHGCTKST